MFVLDGFRARLLLIICCIVCYVTTIRNGYALDDDFAYYNNMYVQEGIHGIPDILTHPYYSDGTMSFDYRPIASITFAVEKEFFGDNPHLSHAINLLLYIGCILLVLGLMTEVFGLGIIPAFLIALFFAVHPVHTEVVASIKNREELLSFIFCLLGFFAVYRVFLQKTTPGRWKYILLTIACLLLSFASKLTSIPMFGIIAIMFYFKGWHSRPKLFYSMLGLIGVLSGLYLLVILKVSNRPVFDLENPLVLYHDLSTKVGTTAASLLFYFKFMWLPYPFSFFYGYNTIPIAQVGDPVALVSILLHLAIFIYGAVLFFRKDITGFFILSYFISISVYSNIVMVYTGIVSERALFFPSLWFIAAVCSFLYSRIAWDKIAANATFFYKGALALVIIWFSGYGVLTIHRATQWQDTIRLMGSDIGHLQNSTLANYFYACVLKNKGEAQTDTALQSKYLAESKQYFYQTNSLSPAYPYGYFRLGLIYRYDQYNGDSAYYYFKKAYSLNSTLTDVDYQYGRAEYEFGDIKIANEVFSSLYQKIPGDTFTVFYHALLLLKTGHLQEGHQINTIFLHMTPTYYQGYFNEGLYYQLSGNPAQAAQNYETSIKYGCTDQTVYRFLIDYYQKLGRPGDANKYIGLLR